MTCCQPPGLGVAPRVLPGRVCDVTVDPEDPAPSVGALFRPGGRRPCQPRDAEVAPAAVQAPFAPEAVDVVVPPLMVSEPLESRPVAAICVDGHGPTGDGDLLAETS